MLRFSGMTLLDPPPERRWPELVGTALISGAVAVLLVRNFFESEKKVRTLISTDYGVGDPPFVRTMSQLLGPGLIDGNKVTILQNGEEIFPSMLDAIASAKRSITFENFVFAAGRIVDDFAQALAERARAGVKVHFLQDAMGCNCLHGPCIRLMERSGVEVEIFRFLHLSRINYRTHRKLLAVDGQIGFIGGVAISDDWCGNGRTRGLWRDTHYKIEGPVVAQVQQAFTENWMQTRATVLHGDDYFPEIPTAGSQTCQVFKSSASEGADSARVMFMFSLAAARKRIRIANAYFIPDDLCVETILEARRRGVDVEVITPGTDIDQRLVRAVGRARWGPMLKAGVRFYEYQPARYHCKYMIVDDCWVSVGSTNFDNRSLRVNEEANLNVLDADFAREHTRIFEEDKANSREITFDEWRRRSFAEKLAGRAGTVLRTQL
jgi:cardiolipin synthase